MPILDIEPVLPDGVPAPSAQTLADAAGRVFGTAPGRTWVRVRPLAASAYAENGAAVAADALPVFVTVLHAHAPHGDALVLQVQALTTALADVLGIAPQRVHVQLAPAGAGRQAFGGTLVR
jgi:phenylpyruvate tautomerase PptA (4-oxalocrotonate tautomerase family)